MNKHVRFWVLIFTALGAYGLLPAGTITTVAWAAPLTSTEVLPPGLTLLKESRAGEKPEEVVAAGDWLFFRLGTALWQSDGTVAGTVVVAQDIFPFGLQACNGQLYFRHTNELLRVNPAYSSPQRVKAAALRGPWHEATVQCSSRRLFFVDGDAQYGQELWQTDGQEGEAALVKDINPGRNGSGIEELFLYQDHLLFSAYDDQAGDALWRSDGTVTGTLSVSALPGPVTEFASTSHALFFKVGCCQLWRADAALTAAVLVKDFSAEQLTEMRLHPARNFVYITANQRPPSYAPAVKGELWRSDGTGPGTVRLPQPFQYISRDFGVSTVNDRIFFYGARPPLDEDNDGPTGWFVSDGTITGTQLLPYGQYARFYPEVSLPQLPNQRLVSFDQALWRTDGTITGTVRLTAVRTGPHTLHPAWLTQFGSLVAYTQPDDHASGLPLWISDGTPAGSTLLIDLAPGVYGRISHLTNANGTLFFFVTGTDVASSLNGLWAYRPGTSAPLHTLYLPIINQK